jgi:hypothetical protein
MINPTFFKIHSQVAKRYNEITRDFKVLNDAVHLSIDEAYEAGLLMGKLKSYSFFLAEFLPNLSDKEYIDKLKSHIPATNRLAQEKVNSTVAFKEGEINGCVNTTKHLLSEFIAEARKRKIAGIE